MRKFRSIETMSVQDIERELDKFAWEYIALADLAQTDAYYAEGEKALDARKVELTEELNRRKQASGLTQDAADGLHVCQTVDPKTNRCVECGAVQE